MGRGRAPGGAWQGPEPQQSPAPGSPAQRADGLTRAFTYLGCPQCCPTATSDGSASRGQPIAVHSVCKCAALACTGPAAGTGDKGCCDTGSTLTCPEEVPPVPCWQDGQDVSPRGGGAGSHGDTTDCPWCTATLGYPEPNGSSLDRAQQPREPQSPPAAPAHPAPPVPHLSCLQPPTAPGSPACRQPFLCPSPPPGSCTNPLLPANGGNGRAAAAASPTRPRRCHIPARRVPRLGHRQVTPTGTALPSPDMGRL